MGNDWRTFRGLTRRDQRLLLQALVLLPLASAALRLIGFRACDALFTKAVRRPQALSPDAESAFVQSAVRMVRVAARRGATRPLCLSRSLVLCTLLRRAGIAAAVRIGVRKTGSQIEAHAWVEYNGTVLNDRADVDTNFQPFGSTGRVGVLSVASAAGSGSTTGVAVAGRS
jgi:hypothetical protein